ncbi:MAG: VWA domain-containing protein [bacterium]|nr:VWA domain-containing protein [bacterium]
MIRLATPYWLALAGLTVVFVTVWLVRRRLQRFPMASVHRHQGRWISLQVTTVAGILAAMAFLPLAVASARPQEVLARVLEHTEGVDMVVALDVSGSMAALDFEPSDRLGVAKEVISSFVESRPDDRFGVVVFAGAAVTLCPVTLDHGVVTHLVREIELRALPDGTAVGLGLGTAVNRLRKSQTESKVIVLVTDGASNAGELDPMTAAELAAQQGITVHTVLVGSEGPVPVPVPQRDPRTGRETVTIQRVEVETNPELLAEIARATGGMSFRARDSEALVSVFAEIDAMERTEFESTQLVHHREKFENWALAAFLLLTCAVVLESGFGRSPW